MNNNQEEDWLKYLKLTLTTISMTGCVFVILLFILVKRIRSFPMEMVCCLCFSCLIVNLSYALYYVESNYDIDNHLCQGQAFLMVFSETSMYLWAALIGYWLFQRVVNLEQNNEKTTCLQRTRFYLMGYILPLIISGIGYIMNTFGPSGPWCWVKSGEVKAQIFSILIYIFTWLLIFINFFYNYLIVRYLTKELQSKEEKQLLSKYIWKLLKYPLIQVICMGPGTLFRFFQVALSMEIKGLSVVHILFTCSQGILYALAYGFTTQVKEVLKELISCVYCRKDNIVESDEKSNSSRKESSNNSDYLIPLERSDLEK
jgi:hypothetical protein